MDENLKAPKISVIMPEYNGEKYLKEAVDSILNQTFTDFELIILNDCSTDGSEDLILSYTDPRIVYVKNDRNLGLIKTLNKGLDLSKGELIARMDQDDIALPSRFEKQVAIFRENPDIGVCGSWLTRFGVACENKLIQVPEYDQFIRIGLLGSNKLAHPTIMLRKNILGVLRYDLESTSAEDFEFWTRLSRITQLYNIQESLLQYRVHNTNISVMDSAQQFITANTVIGKQLEYIGLENNVCNIKYCRFLFADDFQYFENEELEELVNFANKLEQTNNRILFYNQQILKEIINRKLHSIFDGAVNYRLSIIHFVLCNRIDILMGRSIFRNIKLFGRMILK